MGITPAKGLSVVIIANAPDLDAEPYRERLLVADRLIAADGGALALVRIGILPDIVIGDLDSLDLELQQQLAAQEVTLTAYPRAKDETDLELALLYAVEIGATQIDILGALGGRWDHTLANVAMLAMPELRQRLVRLIDQRQTLSLVCDTIELYGQRGDTVSLIPLAGPVHGITTRGLLYPLNDATLVFERARGISNVLLEPPGQVTLREGMLIVVQHADQGEHQWRNGAS